MLEYIVRPFVSPAPQSNLLIPSSPSTTTEKAVLTWGANGTLPTPKGLSVKNECCNNSNDEFSRDWEDVNVHSQTDPSNFITVRRTKALSLHQKTDKSKCDDGWDQSFFANDSLFNGPDDFGFGDSTQNGKDSCKGTYKLNNNTVAEPAPNPGGTGTTTSDAGTGGLATSTSTSVDTSTGLPVGEQPVSPDQQPGASPSA